MIIKWKLYYDDGTTFCDEDGEWFDAPHRGALVLASSDPEVGRELDHGARGEFFAWWPEASKPWGFDRVGILDYIVQVGGNESVLLADLSIKDFERFGVKVGRSVDNSVFAEVLQHAVQDDYIEPKSAWSTREAT